MASQLLTGFAIGTALAGVAIWLGWLLVLAHAWVVEQWGGRLGTYLVLKGRDLCQQSIALSSERLVVPSKRKVSGNCNGEGDKHHKCTRDGANSSPEVAHNVVPFRRKG